MNSTTPGCRRHAAHLSRRPLARIAAQIGGGLCGRRTRRVAASRRSRSQPRRAPLDRYHERVAGALAGFGGRRRVRSRRDELADREPSSDDVSFFRPSAGRTRVLIEKFRLPFGSLCRRVATRISWARPGAAPDRGGAAPGRAHAQDGGCHRVPGAGGPPPGAGSAARRAISHRTAVRSSRADRRRARGRCKRGTRSRPCHRQCAALRARLERRFCRLVQLQVPQRGTRRRRRFASFTTVMRRAERCRASPAGGDTTNTGDSRWGATSARLPARKAGQISNPRYCPPRPCRLRSSSSTRGHRTIAQKKSIALTGYLERLIDERLGGKVEIITRETPMCRGCQLSLRLKLRRSGQGAGFEQTAAAGVVGDWREPTPYASRPFRSTKNSFRDVLGARRRPGARGRDVSFAGSAGDHCGRRTDGRPAGDPARAARHPRALVDSRPDPRARRGKSGAPSISRSPIGHPRARTCRGAR